MAMPIELSTESRRAPLVTYDTAMACLARLSGQMGAAAAIDAASPLADHGGAILPLARLVELGAELGLRLEQRLLDWQGLKETGFADPLLIVRKDGDVVLVAGGGRAGAEEVSVWDPHHDGVVFFVSREDFERAWSGDALLTSLEKRVEKSLEARQAREAAADTAKAMRAARAGQIGEPAETPRAPLGLRFGLVAAITAIASIGIILRMQPDADHAAAAAAPARANSPAAQIIQQQEAALAVVVPATPGGHEAASTFTAPASAGPAN